ncbi:mucin [Thraustotheca clavata]|uniref:Mucin n=1 Tax=Thraustotheca clavata TaxID=74557 RepID=A0A1V9ZCQ7_9STRA|nr:mucin [Thraustotheca clavata]
MRPSACIKLVVAASLVAAASAQWPPNSAELDEAVNIENDILLVVLSNSTTETPSNGSTITPEPITGTSKPTTTAPAPVPVASTKTPEPNTDAPLPDPTTKKPRTKTPRPTLTPKPTTDDPFTFPPLPTFPTLPPIPTIFPLPTTATPEPTTDVPVPSPSTKTPKPTTDAPVPDPLTKTPKPTTDVPVPTPSTKTPTPTDVPVPTPSTKTPTPTDVPVPTPSTKTPTPTDVPVPTPSTKTPTPTDVPVPTPSTKTPTPTDVPVPTPSTKTPAPTDVPVPTPSTKTPTPTDVPVPTPSTKTPTPTDVPVPTPSTKTPTPTDVPVPTPSTKTPKPTDVPVPTPSTNTPTPTDVPVPTPSTKTPTPTDVPVPTPSTKTPTPTDVPVPSTVSPSPTNAPQPTTKYPEPTSDLPVTKTATPGTGTPMPTMIPIAPTSAPVATLDPAIENFLKATVTVTPAPTNLDWGLLQQSTDSPIATTSTPKLENEQTAPPNDHSDNLNRGKSNSVGLSTAELKAQATIGTETTSEKSVRYIANSIVAITLAVLAFFQFIAINPSYLPPDEGLAQVFAPNVWELPLFITFLQGVSLLSLAHNTSKPQLFYTNFLDTFSWLNLLIRASPSKMETSTVSSIQIGHRILADSINTYDASGYADFSLRSNVSEKDWFFRLWAAILVVLAVLLVVAIATALVAMWMIKRGNPFRSDSSDSSKRSVSLRSVSRRLLGMCVIVMYLSYLPLSMISMYEILQDASGSGFPHTNAVLSMITLLLLVAAMVTAMVQIYRKSEAGLSKWQTRVVWGVIYSPYHYTHRFFFGIGAFVQLISGILVASITTNGPAVLIALIVLHLVYIIAIVLLRPFESVVQFRFTLVFEVFLLTIFGVACGLTEQAIEIGQQKTLSYVIIVLVYLVIFVMFVRQLLMLWNFASGWARQDDETFTGVPTANEHEWESGTDNYAISIKGSDSTYKSRSRHDAAYDTSDYDVPNTIHLVSSGNPSRI